MNKYQEALNVLYENIDCSNNMYLDNLISENLGIISELVDKETPKSVVLHYRHNLGTAWGTYLSATTCPCCKHRLKDKPNKQVYCPKCGQHLDWSEFKR